ncbi:hypothetical protein, partial [Caulobacter radicis]|uniref:hypothetical protein n=1 Tax=Caulobacter radicis TaxID=2172650 RepID=UPI001A9CA307
QHFRILANSSIPMNEAALLLKHSNLVNQLFSETSEEPKPSKSNKSAPSRRPKAVGNPAARVD